MTPPHQPSDRPLRIAVIGGGISGLAAALRIAERLPLAQLTLYEASSRLGGVLNTERRDGFLIERSADSFITKQPWAIDLCRRVGLGDALRPTDETKRRAAVVRDGRVLPVPEGFLLMAPGRLWPMMASPVLSWRGKLRLLAELFVPRRISGTESRDESVASFATRRLGREAFERLVQPLVAGIYTADSEKLSMAATLPDLLDLERQHGSLLRGARHSPATRESAARYGLFVAPREGMASLVQAVAERLPEGCVQLNTVVDRLERVGGAWRLSVRDRAPAPEVDGVVLAVHSFAAAILLAACDAELSAELAAIEYAGCAVVNLAYRREQFARPLDGFGFVVPRIERRPIIAASYLSEKFPGRAPAGGVLIRVFIGGALAPELADLPADEQCRLAHTELAALLGICGQPLWTDVARWPRSMPQCHVGHLDRVARIAGRVVTLPGLELAGNAYHGVGIPQCIHSGESAADRIVAHVSTRK